MILVRLVPLFAMLLVAAPAAASISGVCPDGSMFIVKKEADIPCSRAKLVDSQDMPPIRPQYLPRPYAWELHQRKQDPNNPYNLLGPDEPADSLEAEQEDLARKPGAPIEPPHQAGPAPPQAAPAVPPVAAAPPPAAESMRLAAGDIRDMGLIVELTQERVPARFARGEPPTLTIDLAHSRAFEARLHDWYAGDPLGPVVLFQATAVAPEKFHANLTFVQGHHAFTPDRDDPRAFGLLDGSLGAQPVGGAVLGYTVLPRGVDLTAPIDVYWNDRRISVVLQP